MGLAEAIGSGAAGALALTALHESARRAIPDAPRMDVLGRRAIAKGLEGAGVERPDEGTLQGMALGGDLVANSLYYSLVGVGDPRGALVRGAILGLAAGVVLPGPMGLGKGPSARTPQTQLMTVAWYVAGGLAAAAAYTLLARGNRRPG